MRVQFEAPTKQGGSECVGIAIVDRLIHQVVLQGVHDPGPVGTVQDRLSCCYRRNASVPLASRKKFGAVGTRALDGTIIVSRSSLIAKNAASG